MLAAGAVLPASAFGHAGVDRTYPSNGAFCMRALLLSAEDDHGDLKGQGLGACGIAGGTVVTEVHLVLAQTAPSASLCGAPARGLIIQVHAFKSPATGAGDDARVVCVRKRGQPSAPHPP